MNQDKLEVFKQKMERVNIDILGISELKWTGMGKFNSDDHYMATHSSVPAWRILGTGAWWAAVCGVAQSWTRLTRLSSSSSTALQTLVGCDGYALSSKGFSPTVADKMFI